MGPKRNIERIMKRLASVLLIAFGAVYLHAQDSPLVAAARASQQSKKPKKKKVVITNETLTKSGGHITTSATALQPLPALPKTDGTVKPVAQADAAAKAKQDAEDKKKREAAEHANAIYDGDDAEGIYEDPAKTEGRMEKQSPPAPQQPPTAQPQQPTTVQVQKPPV
jgi:hypothetical protein